MNPWIAKTVILVGTVVMIVIRAPHGRRSRSVKVARSHKTPLETLLLVLAWVGFFVPLIWVVSPAFSFAEYPLRSGPLVAGLTCLAIGLWLFFRSHADLGTNWSVTLELRQEHRLITQGVYRAIRHPMYSALALYSVGQALVIPNWVAGFSNLIAFALLLALRLGAEEKMMAEQFGDEYAAYSSRTKRLVPGVWLVVAALIANSTVSAQAPIKVLLLTGQSNPFHNWAVSSAIVKRQLEATGRFAVTVATAPPKGTALNQDMSRFTPAFGEHQVVVLDYEGFEFALPVKDALATYVRNGGGLVILHAANNAFPAWPEFNEMIGVGGWGGFTPGYKSRAQDAGPKIRWRDNGMVLDPDTPGVAQHPKPHDFLLTVRAPNHPIMQGLPPMWLHAADELYANLRGPARNVTILATATAPLSMPGGTGEHEPIVMTINYGKGRVFHNTLGHVGAKEQEPIAAMNSVDYIVLLQRGTEWAATGTVTLPVPADFPTAEKISIR